MKKKELQDKLRALLEEKQGQLRRSVDRGRDKQQIRGDYERLCGVVETMQAIGLLDWEQADHLCSVAWDLCCGRLRDEAC